VIVVGRGFLMGISDPDGFNSSCQVAACFEVTRMNGNAYPRHGFLDLGTAGNQVVEISGWIRGWFRGSTVQTSG
jgi:hypothetical protein